MLTILRGLACLGLGLLGASAPPSGSIAPARPPAASARAADGAVVARLGAALREALPARPLEWAERLERLGPPIAATHDFESMARASLGDRWEALEPAERERFAAAFGRLVVARWAARLDGEGTVSLALLSEAERPDGGGLVRAELRRGDSDPLRIDLEVGRVGDEWRIEGVVAEGEPTSLGQELCAVLESRGAQGLVADVERRVARLAEGPEELVVRLQAALLEAMRKGPALGYQGRLELLDDVIADTHDLYAITKLSVKSDWDALTPEQREKLVRTLSELSFATYAARFDGYKGERFEVVDTKPLRSGVLVKTTLIKSDGQPVRLDYLLHRDHGRWLILNIVADGVSDLAVRRTEYQSLLERKGFDGLIAKLEDQIARYAAGERD